MTEAQQYTACCLLFGAFLLLTMTGDYMTGLLSLGMAYALLMVRTVRK
jgi:hypothetical protein